MYHALINNNYVHGYCYCYCYFSFVIIPYVHQTFHFSTLAPGQTFTAAVIADMGYGEASDYVIADLLALVEAGEIQAVIHSGDISYADGRYCMV